MNIYILGRGGHARCCYYAIKNQYPDVMYIGKNEELPVIEDVNNQISFVNGVGDIKIRRMLWKKYIDHYFIPVIHPSAITPDSLHSMKANGVQIMAGAVIQPNVVFGDNVLINTGAQIDHDCIIGDHCVIAPGAILCGGVKLGHSCFIGAGAIIVQGVELEDEAFVPAGTLVCGSSDFRKPVPMVRDNGTDKASMGTQAIYYRSDGSPYTY